MTPRPPAGLAGRYSRKCTKESRLSSSRNSSEPLSPRAQLEDFLAIYAKERGGHDARNCGLGFASCSRGLVFLRGLQAQSAEDWSSWRGTLQTQMPNWATDGLAPSVLGSFSFAVRVASYVFPPASEEDPSRATVGSGSHHTPEAWCSRKGKLKAQRGEDWCSQKGTLQNQISNEATDGWYRRFLTTVRAHPPIKVWRFRNSFWWRLRSCVARTRGHCDAGRRFVHNENRVYQPSNAQLGKTLDSSKFEDQQHFLGPQSPPRVLRGTKVRMFSDHKALESIGQGGDHNARVQRWLEFLTAFDYTLGYRKGSANGNANFLSRLQEPATEHDRNSSTSLPFVEDGGIYLIRACGRAAHSFLSDSRCRLG